MSARTKREGMRVYLKRTSGPPFSNESTLTKCASAPRIFLDRDPKHFDYVLDYLRNGCKLPKHLPTDPAKLEAIHREFDYFLIPAFAPEPMPLARALAEARYTMEVRANSAVWRACAAQAHVAVVHESWHANISTHSLQALSLPPHIPHDPPYIVSLEYLDEDRIVVVSRVREIEGPDYVIVYEAATMKLLGTIKCTENVDNIACARNWIAVQRGEWRVWGVYDMAELTHLREISLAENELFTAVFDEGVVLTSWRHYHYDELEYEMRIEHPGSGQAVRQIRMMDPRCSMDALSWPAEVYAFGKPGRARTLILFRKDIDEYKLLEYGKYLMSSGLPNDGGTTDVKYKIFQFADKTFLVRIGRRDVVIEYANIDPDGVDWTHYIAAVFEVGAKHRRRGEWLRMRLLGEHMVWSGKVPSSAPVEVDMLDPNTLRAIITDGCDPPRQVWIDIPSNQRYEGSLPLVPYHCGVYIMLQWALVLCRSWTA
jgi:hypothetical protein